MGIGYQRATGDEVGDRHRAEIGIGQHHNKPQPRHNDCVLLQLVFLSPCSYKFHMQLQPPPYPKPQRLTLYRFVAVCCMVPAGYLMGVPVTSYSLGIGSEHVEFAGA